MALAVASRVVSRVSVRVASAQVDHPYPVQTVPSAPPSCSSSRYAILKLGGMRQVVEEDHDYTCLKKFLAEARVSDASDRVVFHNVLGLRSNGEFVWGKPFVPDAAVEVELLDEFPGPVLHCAANVEGADTDTTMARYRVKHINAHSSTAMQQ